MKNKLLAILASIGSALLIILKLKNNKIDALEHENRLHQAKDDIQQTQEHDKTEVLQNEQNNVNQRVKNSRTKSKRDRLNSL